VATESSNQVIALVLATGFAGGAVVVAMLLLLIGLFAWNTLEGGDGIAVGGEDKGHVRDTGVAPEIVIAKPSGSRPAGGGAGGDADPDGVPVAITTGPVSIEVPDSFFFHSLEINCPDAGIRRRASFRRGKASTTGVPINEECTVTFQGSEPATTTIRGGQDKRCVTFNPTECRLK
jgi:hypothetical protein